MEESREAWLKSQPGWEVFSVICYCYSVVFLWWSEKWLLCLFLLFWSATVRLRVQWLTHLKVTWCRRNIDLRCPRGCPIVTGLRADYWPFLQTRGRWWPFSMTHAVTWQRGLYIAVQRGRLKCSQRPRRGNIHCHYDLSLQRLERTIQAKGGYHLLQWHHLEAERQEASAVKFDLQGITCSDWWLLFSYSAGKLCY